MSEVTERIHCRECGSKDMKLWGINTSLGESSKAMVEVRCFCGNCFVTQSELYVTAGEGLARLVTLEHGLDYKAAKAFEGKEDEISHQQITKEIT